MNPKVISNQILFAAWFLTGEAASQIIYNLAMARAYLEKVNPNNLGMNLGDGNEKDYSAAYRHYNWAKKQLAHFIKYKSNWHASLHGRFKLRALKKDI